MRRSSGGTAQRVSARDATSLALYDEAASAAAGTVIRRYSTSFGGGARLLPRAMRRHIEAVYAMVRVADEIVDTYRGPDARAILDSFEGEVAVALERGFSANFVAHAFGVSARAVGIGVHHIQPFFASMRMDLDQTEHTRASFDRYVFGSAEVVGEMCLAVFLNSQTGPRELPHELVEGARRLGAAYQKVNFLRDLATDDAQLGRSYFPGVTAGNLTDAKLQELVADCRTDIAAAEACLPGLPRRAAIAVKTTIDIYARLLAAIEHTPAEQLVRRRIRVADPVKAALAFRNACSWLHFTRRAAA